jgi:hypothetical protein
MPSVFCVRVAIVVAMVLAPSVVRDHFPMTHEETADLLRSARAKIFAKFYFPPRGTTEIEFRKNFG